MFVECLHKIILEMLWFDVINTVSENIVPKYYISFWKTPFGYINLKCFINALLNIFENISNKYLLHIPLKEL